MIVLPTRFILAWNLHLCDLVGIVPSYDSWVRVRIPTWAVGIQLSRLFLLPFGLVDKLVPGKHGEDKLWRPVPHSDLCPG